MYCDNTDEFMYALFRYNEFNVLISVNLPNFYYTYSGFRLMWAPVNVAWYTGRDRLDRDSLVPILMCVNMINIEKKIISCGSKFS